MHAHVRRLFVLALGLSAAASACKKDAPPPAEDATATPAAAPPAAEEFDVGTVELGKGIGSDKRVTSATTTFAPRDTIYASVATTGSAPSKTIVARWTFEDGQVVKADTQTIAPTGPAVTEFHISRPRGWPAGKYKVEIAVDGSTAETKEFEVKR